MRRLVAAAGCVAALLAACGGEPRYASQRQAAEEEVPGSWGLVLRPPPEDLEPRISPDRAREIALRVETPDGVLATLALVSGAFVGERDDTPAWVVMARNLCFAQSKGDLVSSARRDPRDVERCSERNLWVEILDPMTGESLASLGAYDTTGRWVPATGA
ncbi:MAG TPA: hypothetical protein VEC15_00055 [Actinomycetota bacterium]|nr:hypothetical protein [Actinomycetota bacterium]